MSTGSDPDTKIACKLWWMNDNHTFVQIRTDGVESALNHVMECWERDQYGMLCSYDSDHSPFPDVVHGRGRNKKKEFQCEAKRYVENIFSDGEP
jgi:hypothetical protein